MRKYLWFLITVCIVSAYGQAADTAITELSGLESQDGSMHLFYRIYNGTGNSYSGSLNNSVYHYDLSNNTDTLFFNSGGYMNPVGSLFTEVYGYEFRHNNPYDYIYQGAGCGIDCDYYLTSFDGQSFHNIFLGLSGFDNFAESNSNDSIIYASQTNRILKTTNFGGSWFITDSTDDLRLLSINPNNDKEVFAIDQYGFIEKSSDGGKTFSIVDTSVSSSYYPKQELQYDKDLAHIYGVSVLANSKKFGAYLLVSSNKGD
jgi:hypothetical protein